MSRPATAMLLALVTAAAGLRAQAPATPDRAALGAQAAARMDTDALRAQVFATERAFAKSMADRRLDVFSSLVSEEAIFLPASGALRGKAAIVGHWQPFFEGRTAPFSWEPDQVEVLDSGTVAWSSGLVRDPSGKPTGRFNSVWRREADGVWRIVFDKGSPLPPAAP